MDCLCLCLVVRFPQLPQGRNKIGTAAVVQEGLDKNAAFELIFLAEKAYGKSIYIK